MPASLKPRQVAGCRFASGWAILISRHSRFGRFISRLRRRKFPVQATREYTCKSPLCLRFYPVIGPFGAAIGEIPGYFPGSRESAGVNPAHGAPAVSVSVDGSMRDLLIGHPKDLSQRIHFLGATSDADFLSGMALCDTVVFPYLEVGQSSSGPISQALELGCRVVASRTHTFLQLGRYHRNTIEFFDIGNHLELAAQILARPQFAAGARFLSFNVETNKAVYLVANGVPSKIRPAAERDAR